MVDVHGDDYVYPAGEYQLMSNRSPEQKFARFVKGYFLAIVLLIAGAMFSCTQTSPHSEKKPVEVTLINAYSSMQHCGSKGRYSCEVFTGRFRTVDGTIYQREMDGFFYHRYVDQGRQDIPGASITLNDYDQGYENPWYINWLFAGGALGVIMAFCLMFFPLIAYDVDTEQRKWLHEQEKIARREKYGY